MIIIKMIIIIMIIIITIIIDNHFPYRRVGVPV